MQSNGLMKTFSVFFYKHKKSFCLFEIMGCSYHVRGQLPSQVCGKQCAPLCGTIVDLCQGGWGADLEGGSSHCTPDHGGAL